MSDDKRETATFILVREVVSLAGLLAGLYLTRFVMRPDSTRQMKMSVARITKRVAQRQADTWQTVADKAATAYHHASL